MCACGDLDPSYVCVSHRGTPDDWRWWHTDQPRELEEERRDRERSAVDFLEPLKAA